MLLSRKLCNTWMSSRFLLRIISRVCSYSCVMEHNHPPTNACETAANTTTPGATTTLPYMPRFLLLFSLVRLHSGHDVQQLGSLLRMLLHHLLALHGELCTQLSQVIFE